MKVRNIRIDAIKVIACIGVVAAHTLKADLGQLNFMILSMCSYCIPLFFCCSGYSLFKKKEITNAYALRKIGRILLVCFAWEALHALAYFAYYREMRNFIRSFFEDFLQKGLFFHFWYMGAMLIIYLLLPSLKKLQCKKQKLYLAIWLVLGIVCLGIDLLSFVLRRQFVMEVIQTVRLWYWLFFVMTGGIFAFFEGTIQTKFEKTPVGIISIVVILVNWLWQMLLVKPCFGFVRIETQFGSWPVILGCMLLLTWAVKKNEAGKCAIWTERMVALIMGVYIIHPFLLAAISHFVPVFLENSFANLLYWLVCVCVSLAGAWIISKIKYINQLMKL